MAKFQPISEAEFAKAQARADRDPTPYAIEASFNRALDAIQLTLNTGVTVLFGRAHIAGLKHASNTAALKNVVVEGGGSIISFPRLDVYLSIAPLLEQFFGPMEWGRRERRAAASRENGKKGGRPSKQGADQRVLEDYPA